MKLNPNCTSPTYYHELAPKYHKCGNRCARGESCPCPNDTESVYKTIMSEWDSFVETYKEILEE